MELLEYLRCLFGCAYQSDLPRLRLSRREAEAVWDISETLYSLKDYQEAATYLLNTKVQPATIREAKRLLYSALCQRDSGSD
ncbi:MAG: hypothetical protein ACOX64_10870 [Candidatus Merdivicinus sp.]|jgi:hypothetical protein